MQLELTNSLRLDKQSELYKNVCGRRAERRDGFNITLGHLDLSDFTARVDCDEPHLMPPSTPPSPPPLPCEGVASHAFALQDENADFALSAEEARAVVQVLQTRACRFTSEPTTCFGRACGGDEHLSRREYFDVYVPCLLEGVSAKCREKVCRDARTT